MENNTNNLSQDLLEIIERYLNHQMKDDERSAFENKIESNPQLKQQVDDVKTILFGVEESILKSKLNSYHNDISDTTEDIPRLTDETRKPMYIKLAIAASLIVAAGFFWFLNSTSDSKKLYATYFTPDPGLPTTMSDTNNYEFYNAMVIYKQGDYNTAINKWEVLQKKKPNNDTLNYFLGIAHLANKNEASAIKYFDMAKANDSSVFKNDIYYYLGLAHLKANHMELAKKNLNFSTLDNSKKLLSELNN